MDFDLDLAIEVLRRSPATLRALLDGLSEHWMRGNEGPETFSPFDVVGHLIDGEETDWIPRARIITWPKNGIEFYYPPSVLDKIFGAGSEIQISDDIVSRNGLSYPKARLAEQMVSLLDATTSMHEDFTSIFLEPLEATLGLRP